MTDMRVNIAGVELKNPVITASGCFGFGQEYNEFYPIGLLGGISCKGTTLEPREGNPPPRVAETPSGMLNSVGLQNPGIDHFIEQDLPWLAQQGTAVIANIAGNTVEDYCEVARRLNGTAVDLIEINISCPNVKAGGVHFGTSCAGVESITSAVRKVSEKPLMVKLSPNVTDIAELAAAAESAGADAVSLINTLLGMRIDLNTRRPILHNNVGGLSGPAVFPVALRMVWQVANRVKIPVVGMGGIASGRDAIEMMMAGASAVQVGAAIFADPYAPIHIIEEMNSWLDEHQIASVRDIVGSVQPW